MKKNSALLEKVKKSPKKKNTNPEAKSKTLIPPLLEETDPNIASVSITQGADPIQRFLYTLNIELTNFKDNPSRLTGRDLAVTIIFTNPKLGTGFGSDKDAHGELQEFDLPMTYTVYGTRENAIEQNKTSLHHPLWPSFARVDSDRYQARVLLFIKGKLHENIEIPDVEIIEDLDVFF